MTDLTALEALCWAATPGPWRKHDHTTYPFDAPEKWIGYAWVGYGDNPQTQFDGCLASLDRRKDANEKWREQASVDAAYIAAAHPAAVLALIDRVRRAEEWQPIESAPDDGTVILIGRDMGSPWGFVMGYGHYERLWGGVEGWLSQGFYDPPGNLGLAGPTHWRPLPAAPRAAEKKE